MVDFGFCAECSFEGLQDDVKEHARQFQHKIWHKW